MNTETARLSPELRDAYLRGLPRDVWAAMQRIHIWARDSPNMRDKIAVDDVFTYVARLRQQLADQED